MIDAGEAAWYSSRGYLGLFPAALRPFSMVWVFWPPAQSESVDVTVCVLCVCVSMYRYLYVHISMCEREREIGIER